MFRFTRFGISEIPLYNGSYQAPSPGGYGGKVGNTCSITVKPPIKNILKEDIGQAESTRVYILDRKSPLKEDNLSTKDKTAGPEGVLY